MKKTKFILKAVAKIAEFSAKSAAGSASFAGCYQPKEPADLKAMLKKKGK